MKQGVVMEIQTKDAFVFTNECDLVKLPARKDMFVGQSIALPEPKVQSKRSQQWLVPVLAAACVVLLACTYFLLSALILPRAGNVYLALDINPSIELTLDTSRKVTEVTPLNADAWELLQETQLVGLNYEDAIVRWIETLRKNRPEPFEDLLISALIDKKDRSFIDKIMALNGEHAAEHLSALAGLKVRVLFSTDRAVKEQADANRLSIGRQLLLNLAIEKDLGLTADAIRTGSLGSLLNDLLNDGTTQTIDETTTELTTESSTSETSVETSPETSNTAAITETTPAATSETVRETTKATTASGPQLNVSSSASGWALEWTISPAGKELSYYKVAISQTDSTPKYPDNGYQFALSRESNNCLVNNSKAYNGGDFGGYLTVGQKYYVCITYVFKDGSMQYSNVRQLTYNGPARVEPAPFSPVLEAAGDADGWHLGWSVSPDDRTLKYYKVVISKTDGTPQYSENGYLYALSRVENSCTVNNTSPYNGTSDFGSYLTVGQEYYVAVTYVFSDTKITSNVLRLVYNGPPADGGTPTFTAEVTGYSDETGVHLSWSVGPETGLQGYKVVISKNNSSPAYPDDGYLFWITDRNQTSCLVDCDDVYNGGDIGGSLVTGQTYYFAITYLLDSGKVKSNTLQFEYKVPTE